MVSPLQFEERCRYVYDGTFEGWLTAVDLASCQPERVQDIVTSDAQPDLFSTTIEIQTDWKKAEDIFQNFRRSYSEEVILDILYAFLSESEGIELALFRFVLGLWAHGEQTAENFADEAVLTVKRTRERVAHEILRFHGFVRFRRLKNGIYYAPIIPEANIVQFLAPHFSERFADQSWVIHDTRRNTGLYYNGFTCRYLYSMAIPRETVEACKGQAGTDFEAVFSDNEKDIQSLWDQYFQSIVIKERINPRLQRQRMPVRYWSYLVERPRYKFRD